MSNNKNNPRRRASVSRTPLWSGITHNWEVITPEIAEEILENAAAKGYKNRKLRKGVVDVYANDMKNGDWQETNPQPIVIDDNGVLVDGQHRLSAVVQSGVTLAMFVTRNVPHIAVPTMDIGIQRSVSDAIQFNGMDAPKDVAAVVKHRLTLKGRSMQTHDSARNLRISKPEMYKEASDNAEEYKLTAEYAKQVYNASGKSLLIGEVGGIFLYLTKDLGWDEETVKKFFDKLVSAPRGGRAFNPFKKTMSELGKKKNGKKSDRVKVFIKAWNAMVRGHHRRKQNEDEWFIKSNSII